MDKTTWAFSLVLVGVGIAGVCAAYRTLRAIQKQANEMTSQRIAMQEQLAAMQEQLSQMKSSGEQTGRLIEQATASAAAANISAEAAKINAEAAKTSAEALIKSERAWIHGDFVRREVMAGVIRYSLTITNQGKTPAKILGYDIWHGLLTEGETFSKIKLTTHFSESKQLFIGGDKTETLRDDFDLDELFTFESGIKARDAGIADGAFCVTIKYADVVNVGGQELEHTTSFAYLYNMILPMVYRMAQYNEYP